MAKAVYTPILKLKQAELKALKLTPDASKSLMRPLFEIAPIPLNYPSKTPRKTLAEHIEKLPSQIANSWGSRPFYLDCCHVAMLANNSPQLIGALFSALLTDGNIPIPVLNLAYHPAYSNYATQMKDLATQCGNGACIRITNGDLQGNYLEKVQQVLQQLHISPEQVDIMFDLATIAPGNSGPISAGMVGIIQNFPELLRWRSLILAGTAFPPSMSVFETNSGSLTPRSEWEIWNSILSSNQLTRPPAFGDYGIASAEPFEMDPRMMKLGAKIKYALDNSWLIVKGAGIESSGSQQFHGLCDSLISSQYYYGPTFSAGDQHIMNCAARNTGPGNQTTWLYVGMNHHFAVVLQQLGGGA